MTAYDELEKLRKEIATTCKDGIVPLSLKRKWNKLVKQSKTSSYTYHICEDVGHDMGITKCKVCNKSRHQIRGGL